MKAEHGKEASGKKRTAAESAKISAKAPASAKTAAPAKTAAKPAVPAKTEAAAKTGASAAVVTGGCPYAGVCGGCTKSGIPYEKQLAEKHAHLEELLGRYGRVEPVLPSPMPLHYRNKVVRSFAQDRERRGGLLMGIYAAGSRQVVPVDTCEIEDEGALAILASVKTIAEKQHIPAFDPKTGAGVLRHAMVRAGQASGEYLLTLVTGNAVFPGRNNFLEALKKAHPELTSVVQNVNGLRTGMVLGDPQKTGVPDRVLYGPGFIYDTLCGLRFRISAHSFYQVNRSAAELLYRTAVTLADPKPGERVLDAYCGIGTIGMTAASMADGIRVTGVELNPDAVKDAAANAKQNGMNNIRFIRGDAGEILSGAQQDARHFARQDTRQLRPDLVLLDPPRSGSDETFLSALCHAEPEKIVYISCGPDSLARDLAYLTKYYRVERICPVDLFPGTGHVETVVLMSRADAAGRYPDGERCQ